MTAALIIVFVAVYTAIALEEPLRVNKSATALVGAGLLWTIFALGAGDPLAVSQTLDDALVETAQIAFFLMGAMTVVEVVDAHDGFTVITSRLRSRTLARLAVVISVLTFFLSAVLDNLATTIVIVSLLKRLLRNHEDRLLLAGMTVIAANAGGAWSPIGDVTTTMLWIGGQVTTSAIVTRLILPSFVCMIVPLGIVTWMVRGKPIVAPDHAAEPDEACGHSTPFERNLMFTLGILALLAVPLFKAITHLPPFLGILLAVATLEHAGVLGALARWLDQEIGRLDVIVLAFGLLSAVIDNVPMVAAAMGMYDLATHPPDSFLWEFLAYCTGTGGSILIIGSAAGVAAMGAEKIGFLWYLRRFALLALVGYVAGACIYALQDAILA
jgi:Na+/H+ antiporter NhaD/arsenite permease-like protein